MKRLLAAVSPSSEYLYEGKADVVYLHVTNSVWSTSERLVVEILTIGAIQVRFLSFPFFGGEAAVITQLAQSGAGPATTVSPKYFAHFYNKM